MRVVMIGGAGFLGYFTCAELVARGHEVISVGLSLPDPAIMPSGVHSAICNVDDCAEAELHDLLAEADCVIHAAGADGRFSGARPVIEAYRARNVEPMRRVLTAMHRVRASNLVIFGSYYTALARARPDLVVLSRNPYPLSREEQTRLAFDLAGAGIAVNVLELPYIFGGAPGRGTLWGYIMDKVRGEGPVHVPAGRTACVSAVQVGQAAAGAVERGAGHATWAIGGANLSYREIYGHFGDALGVTPRFVPADPEQERLAAVRQMETLAERGIETGYDPMDVAKWQEAALDIDPGPAMAALNYGPADLAAAIRDTVAATLAHGGQGPASLRVSS